jgi:hypothetical protein
MKQLLPLTEPREEKEEEEEEEDTESRSRVSFLGGVEYIKSTHRNIRLMFRLIKGAI